MYKGGTLQDFAGSMAESIEKEFDKIWADRFQTPLPEATRDDRRLLFIAISHGIIKHLREMAEEAFDIRVKVDQLPMGNLIVSNGKTKLSGGYYSHRHDVTILQKEETDPLLNKVESEGEGIVRILMEELDS